MERLGLDATKTPVGLYSAAGHPTATRENDCIYGIMQVFGLRLGKSATPEKEYALAELEIQIATASTRALRYGRNFLYIPVHSRPVDIGAPVRRHKRRTAVHLAGFFHGVNVQLISTQMANQPSQARGALLQKWEELGKRGVDREHVQRTASGAL